MGTSDDLKRYERYERVVRAIAESDAFTLADLKQAVDGESAGFVTRIVGQLQADGYLQRDGAKSNPNLRWVGDRAAFSAAQWIDSKVYGNRLTRAPLDDRPRERLLAHGAAALRTAELLAILIRSGRSGESALQAGEKVAARYSDQLKRLIEAGRGELKGLSPAVGNTAFCQIMAGIELGRRVASATKDRQPVRIRGAEDAVAWCRSTFARLAADGDQEEFHIVTLDTKGQIIGKHQVSVGLLDQAVVHPREVFRPAIKDAAKSVILVHNHPSGDPTPSKEDRALTGRLQEAGRTVEIQVLDHIIVARNGTVSVRECGA